MSPSTSRYASAPDGSPQGAVTRPDAAANAAAFDQLQDGASGDRPILIKNAAIVSGDPDVGNLTGDLLVRGSTIAEIGHDLSAEGAIVIDATNSILAPGFVDSHLHAWEGQLRGTAPGIDFETYTGFTHGGFAAHYRPHDMYVGTLTTLLSALNAGVTTVIDNSHNSRSAEHSNAAVEALFDSGLRGVHASGAPQVGEWDEQWPGDITRLREEYFSSSDQLVSLRLFDIFPMAEVWEFARNEGLWISSEMGVYVPHLSDLAAAGLLTPEHTFNHCFAMPEADWKLIADAGVQVNLAPRSDSVFGLGPSFPPLDAALEHGIRPGLSLDNEISYAADPFAEMQYLYTAHRSRTFERANAGDETAPAHLSVADVLEFATIRGAENANLGDRTGSLKVGKEADFILVSAGDPNTAPLSNATATLVTFANPGNVHAVFVAGKVRKWDGKLVGVDVDRVHDLAVASRDHLLAAAGKTSDVFSVDGTRPA